jgi:hypothetical protein
MRKAPERDRIGGHRRSGKPGRGAAGFPQETNGRRILANRHRLAVIVKRVLAGMALVLLGGVALIAIWALRLSGDPMKNLERKLTGIQVASDSTYAVVTSSGESRQYRDLLLTGPDIGEAHITLSLPAERSDTELLPVVFVLGGLEVGRESLKYIPHHGRNALVAYQYPYSPEYWYEGTPFTEIPAIQRAVLSVPSQIAAAFQWAVSQPWADAGRAVLLGYSFGGFFVPATYRLVEHSGLDLHSGVIAYAGADLVQVFQRNLDVTPAWKRDLLARAAALALAPLEPSRHLPHLTDDMLLLNGSRDTMIPAASIALLHELKPEPRTIIELDADHMHPDLPDLTMEIVETSRGWLLERGAVEP